MGSIKSRMHNERFYDAYRYFDRVLADYLDVDENGVNTYLIKMKEAVVEAREVINEWDVTYERLVKIRTRYNNLDKQHTSFDDFQGKDEDVVWMTVFMEKLDAKADPLGKYSTMEFTYKTRGTNKSFFDKLRDMFS